MNTFEKIYSVVREIPKGKVASYGQVALMAGNPRWARVVGYALHSNPLPGEIPCHRVVFSDGRLSAGFAFGGKEVQRALLEGEGVTFDLDGKRTLYINAECKVQNAEYAKRRSAFGNRFPAEYLRE